MANLFGIGFSSVWDRNASLGELPLQLHRLRRFPLGWTVSLLLVAGLTQPFAQQAPTVLGSTNKHSLAQTEQQTPLDEAQRKEGAAYFEIHVKPVLCDHCIACHNDRSKNGGVSFEHRGSMLRGGSLGPSVVPGDLENSVVVHAVRRDGMSAPMMPPGPKLADPEIDAIIAWIRLGAPWGADPIGCKRTNPDGPEIGTER